jgi:hypothetical protein
MKHWLAIISLEHARIAASSGFLQVCHGKAAPLRRTSAGDEFFIYSPKTGMGSGDSIMAITYRGIFDDDHVYQVEQAPGFKPFRKDVTFDRNFQPVSIRAIVGMELTANANWGLIVRRGFVELSAADATHITGPGRMVS